MKIKFSKMHGLGNSYIYIDCVRENNFFLDEKKIFMLAKKLSDKNFGIGADGLILILKSNKSDFKMRIINSDGTEAEMCGNGIRCVGKFVYEKKLVDENKKILEIETLAGIKKLELEIKNNLVKNVKVDMGKACFDVKKIGIAGNKNKIDLVVDNKKFVCECVSIGNPHAVIFLDDLDFKNLDVKKYGYEIENNICFKNKINVEFAKIKNKNCIDVKVWERGSGITLACGTGACAVFAVALKNNLIDKNKIVKIKLPGGGLNIFCDEKGNIFMSGEAKNICDGIFDLDNFVE
ncbi:MAG: diaminopimelate epimerase [Firmicutes bacterium]|nr:diaminopimelate epimerase [Bacillota bacterium]